MPKRRSKGEGTIYQRKDGSWCAQTTMPDGRRCTKYNKSQSMVRDWLTEQRSAIQSGKWASSRDVTVGEFIERYIQEILAPNVRPQTLESYQGSFDNHILPELGRIKLSALQPGHAQKLYTQMQKKGLASGTILIAHGLLRQSLNQAMMWSLVPRNPILLARPPRRSHEPPKLLSETDLERLLVSTKGHWLGTFLALAVTTGMRRGEILALHWSNVHLDDGYLEVSQGVIKKDGQHILAEPKTRNARRRVTLPKLALEVLRDHQSRSKSELVFPNTTGGIINPDVVDGLWSRKLDELGIPRVTVHSLRHLHSTMLLVQGISPKVVQERLGHSSIAITLGTYSHVTPALEKGAASAIDKALGTA